MRSRCQQGDACEHWPTGTARETTRAGQVGLQSWPGQTSPANNVDGCPEPVRDERAKSAGTEHLV